MMAIAAIGLYIWQNEQDKNTLLSTIEQLTNETMSSPQPTVIPEIDDTTTMMGTESANTASGSAMANAGNITGSLSFPGEEIPEMMVCAETIGSTAEFCTDERLEDEEFTYGVGYNLAVPAGSYYVYAKLPNDSYKAYYSDFVTCGLSVDCPSHQSISVTVNAGETVENVDPQDWYNQQLQDETP